MKTLHIVAYEKFLSHIIEVTEAVNPGQNRYIVSGAVGQTSYAPPACIPYRAQPHAFRLDAESRADLEWCDAVFLHPLNGSTSAALGALRPEAVAVWCAMGSDIYKYWGAFSDRLHLPKTAALLQKLDASKKEPLSRRIRKWLPMPAKPRSRRRKDAVLDMASRVDFLCAVEETVTLDRLPEFRATKLGDFGYYTYEAALSLGAEPLAGDDILVGNSAYPSNNHLDLFEQLQSMDLRGGRVVLPLSYGPEAYADAVAERALNLFGDDGVVILRDWMPVADYNRILNGCGTVMMNHIRGQAMGNIVSMMIRGARVYLRPENPYVAFLKGIGVEVDLIAEGKMGETACAPLSDAEKARNARILIDYWSKASATQRLSELFATISREAARCRG
jgi:hypothetical protein